MRISCLLGSCLLLALGLLTSLAAETTSTRPAFTNFKVSSRTIALNQTLRVEFTTLPRQVEGVDIARVVTQAVDASRLDGKWRPLGEPTVSEHEKTHTITVSFAVLPRKVGELALPRVPLTWIADNQVAEFGLVTVQPQLVIGGNTAELPGEVSGIAGHLWGERLDAAQATLPKDSLTRSENAIIAKPMPGLELYYRDGALGEATLTIGDLPLARARDSFLSRWGATQVEEGVDLTWILGWTRITATTSADGTGTLLRFVREDIQGILDRARVGRDVFGVLDGRQGSAPAIDPKEQRQQDAERELKRLTGETPEK